MEKKNAGDNLWKSFTSAGDYSSSLQGSEFATQIQPVLLREYRNRMSILAPDLQDKGREIGENIIMEIRFRTTRKEPKTLHNKDLYDRMEPYLEPVLTPFIAGLKQPFREERDRLVWRVATGMVFGLGLSAVSGYLLGRTHGQHRE